MKSSNRMEEAISCQLSAFSRPGNYSDPPGQRCKSTFQLSGRRTMLGYFRFSLGQAPGQKASLGIIAGECERLAIGRGRRCPLVEALQQVAVRCGQQIVHTKLSAPWTPARPAGLPGAPAPAIARSPQRTLPESPPQLNRNCRGGESAWRESCLTLRDRSDRGSPAYPPRE